MKKYFLIIILLISFNTSFTQTNSTSIDSIQPTKKSRTNYGLGFLPSKAQKTDGLAIGWLFLGALESDSAIVNGMYANISPVQVIFGLIAIPFYVFGPITEIGEGKENDYLDTTYRGTENKINGLSISLLEFSDRYVVNGLQITGLGHDMYKLKGMSITAGVTTYSSFKGVMVSGLVNNTQVGKGLQIGLVNRTQIMTGVQIGLWNKIGKRGFPILNMNFKKEK